MNVDTSSDSDSEYDLFDWWSDFDNIIETQPAIIQENTLDWVDHELPSHELKYLILNEFMKIKANTIRMQNSLVWSRIEESNLTEVGYSDQYELNYFGASRKRGHTEYGKSPNSNLLPISTINSSKIQRVTLDSSDSIQNESYIHLLGYIDTLGMFWINKKQGFDELYQSEFGNHIQTQNEQSFETEQIKQWRDNIKLAAYILTGIYWDKTYVKYSMNQWLRKDILDRFKNVLTTNRSFDNYFYSLLQVKYLNICKLIFTI